MKTIDQEAGKMDTLYPLERLCTPEQALFLDIETTGFTARSSSLYLIGCAYYRDGSWHTLQWLAENPSEESAVLQAFFEFSKDFSYLIHYNGGQFDLPYLQQKSQQLDLKNTLDSFDGIDLYRRVSACKKLLNLPNYKQKSLEAFLSLDREDLYTGEDLISVYREYVKTPTPEAESVLLLHNREDLTGMLSILPMLAYFDCLHETPKAKKVQANHYLDVDGKHRMELVITVQLPISVPKPVTASWEGCYIQMTKEECVIRVPAYQEEMKYFYANYKDYYYLPEEDLALHKSVATFVDKEHRIQATAQNCYTRKVSVYLKQWKPLFAPIFKRDYHDPELFFELTDEMKKNRSVFAVYASHILSKFAFH